MKIKQVSDFYEYCIDLINFANLNAFTQ